VAVRPILTWPDPRLSAPCHPVGGADVSVLAADLLDTMYAAPGRGLAAPQIGVLMRVFVMDVTWKDGTPAPRVVIDPQIVWRSDETVVGPEGCLSIRGVLADVRRARDIRLAWTDLAGRRVEETLTGFAAICAQHEYDHLDGLVTFDRLPPDQRGALMAAYQDRLPS